MVTWVMIRVLELHLHEILLLVKQLYGEFLMNAQGEDVVAGIRTPDPIEKLKEINVEVYNQFAEIAENSRSITKTCRIWSLR